MGRPRKNPVVDKKSVKNVIKTKPLKIKNADDLAKIVIDTPKKSVSEKDRAKATSFFKSTMKYSGNEWSAVAADGIEAGDISGYLDSGSYSLNALVAGKMRGGGFPNSKIIMLAGESSTGKTRFVIECLKNWLDLNPTGGIYFFETESAISKDMLLDAGADVNRIFWMPVVTVQELRTQTTRILSKYLELDKDERPPMLFILDSLGMISTQKEVEDSESGSDKQDMTRAKLIKSLFRVLTLKLGRAGVTFFVTSHTYDGQGMFATREISGGQGSKYGSSVTLMLSSRKEKDGTDVIGRIITCTLQKGRLTKQDKKVEIYLDYQKGLNRYFGLLDIGLRQGIFKKIDKKWKIGKQEGKESDIYANPLKYFTPEVMIKLEEACAKEFLYGSSFAPISSLENELQISK